MDVLGFLNNAINQARDAVLDAILSNRSPGAPAGSMQLFNLRSTPVKALINGATWLKTGVLDTNGAAYGTTAEAAKQAGAGSIVNTGVVIAAAFVSGAGAARSWFLNGRFFICVQVSSSPTYTLYTSTTGSNFAADWTACPGLVSVPYQFFDMVWVPSLSLYIAVASYSANGGYIFSSADGVTFTQRYTGGAVINLYGLAWNGTKLGAFGTGGSSVTSTNGTTWAATAQTGTAVNIGTASFTPVQAGGDNKFISIGNVANGALASADGIAFSLEAILPALAGTHVSTAVSPSGVIVVTTSDPTNNLAVRSATGVWTALPGVLPASTVVSYAGGAFVGLTPTTLSIWRSTDGVTWALKSALLAVSTASQPGGRLVYGNNLWLCGTKSISTGGCCTYSSPAGVVAADMTGVAVVGSPEAITAPTNSAYYTLIG